jgi:ABC-type sugar transport system ATPase subunit
MATNPKVIIFDEPTRGIDIGAKTEIYELINKMAASSIAVVVVSSELQELIGVSDRIIVISEGRISGEFEKHEFDPDLIMKAATNWG